MSLYIVSLNATGLRKNVMRKALFLFAKQFQTDFCFFQESHSVSADANFWRSQWGNDIWLSERSAGVTTMENTFGGNILHSECGPIGHFICLVISYNDITLITVNFYGYNTKHVNDELLESIEQHILHWLSKFPNSLLLIEGDFSITIDNSTDRWPPGRPTNQNLGLILFMEKFDLTDIWRERF